MTIGSRPTALYFAAHEINEHPEAQLIYTDEDKLDRSGRRYDPHFKSDWNYDLLLSQNYISHLSFYRRELIEKAGGFRQNFEGAQDYDLTLRCAEQIDPSQIRHIPRILYHWRAADSSAASSIDAKPHARESALRAVQEHLDRRQIRASVEPHRTIYQRVKYELPADLPWFRSSSQRATGSLFFECASKAFSIRRILKLRDHCDRQRKC